jgi:hypothetical protein
MYLNCPEFLFLNGMSGALAPFSYLVLLCCLNITSPLCSYKKTTCQFEIKLITKDYLQMYQTSQLFTNTFTNLHSSKQLKIHMCRQKVIKKCQAH